MKKLLGCTCPSARITDGKLVLSLPDAVTPVMWVIDLNADKTVLLRVAEAENNQYVLQKTNRGAKPDAIEDIAYYTRKGKAIRALTKATEAMDRNERTAAKGIPGALWSWTKTIITWAVLLVLFAYWMIGTSFGSGLLLALISLRDGGVPVITFEDTAQPQLQPPLTPPNTVTPGATNPDAVGVPMSAEDFLQNRSRNVLPY